MPARRIKHGRGGFTLAELVVSIAITAVIGSAVVGLATALSMASEHGRDRYLSLQTARMTMRRIQDTIRKAKLVTAASSSSLVLWAEDSNGDGRINLTEIVLLRLVPGTGEIRTWRIVFPERWPKHVTTILDTEVKLEDLTSIDEGMWMYDPLVEVTVLAGDVTDFNVRVSPAPPMTELVGLSITAGRGRHAVTLRTAAHPRQAATDLVGIADSKYMLMTPGELYESR